MASPGKSPNKPPHCQLRATTNSIKKMKNDMELQLAALSTYATEANGVSKVLTGNRALRESLNRDFPPILDSLDYAVREMQRLSSRCSMLETKVSIIEHDKKVLRQKFETATVKLETAAVEIKTAAAENSSLQEMLSQLCPAGEDMEL